MLGAGLTLLCSSLNALLAWIAVSAEHAPDLLRMSPAPQRTVRLAKLAAAVLPPLALVFVPLAWLLVRAPFAGLLVLCCVTGAVCTAALIVYWCRRPGSRSNFQARGKSDFMTTTLELFNSLARGRLAWALSALVEGVADKLIVATSSCSKPRIY